MNNLLYVEAESVGATAGILTLLATYAVMLFIPFVISIVQLIFQGIGLSKMHTKLGLSGGWLSFVPILNFYALGKVAEQYVKSNGKKSAKFSLILLLLNVIPLFLMFAYIIFVVFMITGLNYMDSESGAIPSIFGILMFMLVFSVFSLAYLIVSIIAYWRVFAIFDYNNATLFTVLYLVVPIAIPFIIFAIRNNEPERIEKKNTEPIVEDSFATVCND